MVECQDERSQHKNRSRAMALLKARLLAAEQEKQQSAQAQSRKLQVGSGDRSERIRTYNFPQGRVTDHRINLTLYKLQQIMDGELDELLDALQQEYQAEQLRRRGVNEHRRRSWSSTASPASTSSLPVAGPGRALVRVPHRLAHPRCLCARLVRGRRASSTTAAEPAPRR